MKAINRLIVTTIFSSIIFVMLYSTASVVFACYPHESLQCDGNAVYWYDHCGYRQDLVQQCAINQVCQEGRCLYIACRFNSDCGTSGSTGNYFCQSGNVYQNYKTYTCNNPGTPSSSCTNSTTAQLKTTCSGNQTCSNGNCVAVACSTNSQCGTNGNVGNPFCQSGNVYQNYKTYTCNNPGTSSSSCTNSTTAQLKTTCTGSQTCSSGSCADVACSTNSQCGTNRLTGNPFCQGNNVYQNYISYTCNNPGTSSSSCTNSTTAQLQTTCSGNQTCSSGSCTTIACSTDSQCGTNRTTGNPFCQSGNVYQNYISYTCNNPGTSSSSCTNSTTAQLQTTCSGNQTCSNGSCNNSCTSNYQERCSGNSLYWYDSCGNQQNLAQYCSNGCSGNSCITNNCTSNYQERCSGNSLYWYDSCGNQQNLVQYCSNGCSGNSCLNNTNSTLIVNKAVRDLTTGTSFATSTYANPSDMLMFMITLQASGSDAQNVFVRDTLPANLIYANQLIVACTGGNNGSCNNNYNSSGSIVSGISLNTIYAGQTVTITYQTQVAQDVNFAYGTTTLNNLVSTTSSNVGYVPNASASVVVTKATVLGASTVSTGLTNNFWVDSFFLPLMITLILLWMWKTGMFFGIEKWVDDKKKVRRGYKAEKELSSRIEKIQKYGNK